MKDRTLENYRVFVRGKHAKPETRRTLLRHPALLLIRTNKTTKDLTQDDLGKYFNHCSQMFKTNGNAIRFWAIKKYLEWAKRTDLDVPVIYPVDAGKQALNEKNQQKLLDTIENLSALHRLVFYLEHDTIRRPIEIRGLQLNDRYQDVLSYNGKTRSKTGRQQCIMTQRLMKAWDDYLLVRPIPQTSEDRNYLILSDYGRCKGKHLTTNCLIIRIIREAAMTAGIELPPGETQTNYLIKRTAITRGLQKCNDPKILQLQAGHLRLETTMKYDRVGHDEIRDYLRLSEGKKQAVKENNDVSDGIKN